MNNNFFSMLRYFREMNIDAHLLLYSDELAIFQPENDTWEIEKWRPYIHQTNLTNGNIVNFISKSSKTIWQELEGYDYYIGTGFAPAYFYKAKLQLDIYIPYSVGIEFIKSLDFRLLSKFYFYRFITNFFYRYFQIQGLKKNTKLIVTNETKCIKLCEKKQFKYIPLSIPMVFKERQYLGKTLLDKFSPVIERFSKSDWVVFSHTSHIYNDVLPINDIKKNYLLIKGFSRALETLINSNPLLVLLEYGKDVECSKKLIKELGIENNVLWLPKMTRKEILYLLNFVDLGASEFGGAMWGGTGWEFLASGVTFLHNLGMTDVEFETINKIPTPPFLQSESEEDICCHLIDFHKKQTHYKEMGKACKIWFEQYQGQGLANQYIEILEKSKNNE